jgi:hydroxymethylpyrimidine/phosphomethylpyrimidine kinase
VKYLMMRMKPLYKTGQKKPAYCYSSPAAILHLALAGDARFCTDVLISDNIEHLTSSRVETQNHHGTGCTLSAAIASFIAHGFSVPEAVQHARQFVQQALRAAANQQWPGYGPLNHFFAFGKTVTSEIPL